MNVKLLTERLLEFLSLNGGCRGSSESTHFKMPHCWKSHALALTPKLSTELCSQTRVKMTLSRSSELKVVNSSNCIGCIN